MPDTTPTRIARPRYRLTIPDAARAFPGDPKEVVMEAYTLAQEVDALKAAAVTGQLIYELLRRCVVEVDGKKAGLDWMDSTSPSVRILLGKALDRYSTPSKETEDDFFKSVRVEV